MTEKIINIRINDFTQKKLNEIKKYTGRTYSSDSEIIRAAIITLHREKVINKKF